MVSSGSSESNYFNVRRVQEDDDDTMCGYPVAEFQKLPENVQKALKVA